MAKKETFRILNIVISSAAGLALIFFVLRLTDLQETLSRLSLIGLPEISLILVMALGYMFISSLRWWFILKAESKSIPIPFWKLFLVYVAGWPIDYLLPSLGLSGQMGRGYIAHRLGLPKKLHVSSLSMEYIMRGMSHAIAVPIGLGILAFYGIPEASKYIGYSLFVMFVLGALGVYVWRHTPKRFKEYKMVITHGFKKSPGWMTLAFVSMLFTYGFSIVQILVYGSFLGITLTYSDSLLYYVVSSLWLIVPAPLSIGITEAGAVLSFSLLGLDTSDGLALGLLFRMNDVLLAIAGAILLVIFIMVKKRTR